jgi:hypothetical protein
MDHLSRIFTFIATFLIASGFAQGTATLNKTEAEALASFNSPQPSSTSSTAMPSTRINKEA